MVFLLSVITVLSLGMGCSPGTPRIVIEEPEAKLSPVMLGVGSIFMKIRNSGNSDDTLLYVAINISGALVELHDMKDGKMMKTERIPIPSGSMAVLRPGGLHIMVFKLPGNISEEQEFTLRLVFEKSGEKMVPVRFRPSRGSRSPSSR
jgi:copper(I)-binding protein